VNLQSAIRFLYPPQCLACGSETTSEFALCGACWGNTPFISGLVCDACSLPLPGEGAGDTEYCDACLIAPRPWGRGRAVMRYDGTARRLVLALKYGDRLDLARPMAMWFLPLMQEIKASDHLLAPVPLHPRRLFFRRFNQAALLAEQLGKLCGLACCPDLLRRNRATRRQDGMSREDRFENQRQAFSVPEARKWRVQGRNILLIDDVMTSGATLSACTEACFAAGAVEVNVLVLARVARDT
jgi:ComF family protein